MMTLSEQDIAALRDALETESRFASAHENIQRCFGPFRELARIAAIERGQVAMLQEIRRRHGLRPAPAIAGAQNVHYGDAARALAEMVAAERRRATIYQRLGASTNDAEITAVIGNLERASREGHLPTLRALRRQLRRRARVPRRATSSKARESKNESDISLNR